jgi:glycosyltransferase involved in cell wall biosynthesis
MKKVLIATPTYDGKVNVWYANSLAESIRLGLVNDIYFQPVYMAYDALVQRARNDLLDIAIKGEFDDIIWIDADIEWNPEWLLKLLNYEEDVVGGTYRRKAIDEAYVVKCQPENLIENDKGLIEVKGLGTGFLKMSKKAFTYLWDNSPSYDEIDSGKLDRRWAFDVVIENGNLISEDITVSKKLIKGKFKIYLDPTMTCSHVGTLKFTGDFKDFMKRLSAKDD